MSQSAQLSLGLDKPHRNQYLFSDHYLEEILRREAAWTAAQGPAAEFLAWLRELYAAEAAQLEAYSESQLEDHWIKPILGRLGHVWEGQATIPGMDGSIKRPDYIFFPNEAARKTAVSDQRTEEYARFALAAGEVKAWPVNLSRKAAGAPVFDNNNPMFQIDYYLKAGDVSWGIVSNGRFWRLVHKDSSYRLDRYFEIDLREALTTPDNRRALAVATYFTLFFGRAAFAPDDTGRVFLNEVLAGSNTYAVALESDLRDNAYKALEQLITGFFAPSANGLDPDNEADRAAVYRNSLLLLYRLLFLFYGESRGLLPMGNERYRERSLTTLAGRMAKVVDDHKIDTVPPMTRIHWATLKTLFDIINGDDAGLNAHLGVPRYNGGLFDPTRHPFLEAHFVGDAFLVRAVDYLARRRKTENGRYTGFEAVDYRTLGVRQLGSIYEGLLEYKVSVAAEAMVTVRKGGKETWQPAREGGKAKVIETRQPGELYLATDKGERKATGSYYTPDYIVKYIVEQTLGPLVEEAREKIRDTKYEIRDKSAAARFEAAILSLNVLDPAMGSGHFLVEATNFLARALATADLATSDELRVSSEDESDLTYWKRRVVEACIYGVDKNELAVELAKLSLWLETVAADKPLSFLDHHLRHGDSLIGARLSDLEVAPGAKGGKGEGAKGRKGAGEQEPLFDESAFTTNVGQAVGGMAAIETQPTDDIDIVHAKEDAWHIIHDTHLGRWRQLADLWVSAWFGNDMSAGEYRDLAQRIQGKPGGLMSDEQAARYLEHPAAVANDYFHWELEFPEVFFDRYGRPKGERAGFDAVVGNPPYVSAIELNRTLSSFVKPYWQSVFKSAHGAFDLYVIFFERSLQLTSYGRLMGFITPNKYLSAPYALALRQFLIEHHTLMVLFDVTRLKVFEDASVYPVVTVVRQGKWNESVTVEIADSPTESRLFQHGSHLLSLLPDQIWGFLLSNGIDLIKRIGTNTVPLFRIADVGASTTAAEADTYSEAILEAGVDSSNLRTMPIVNTGVIDRYVSLWGINLLTHQGKQFLRPVLLLNSPEVSERRREQYMQAKLIIAKVALRIEALCDFGGQYASMNTNFIRLHQGNLLYFAAICNSTLLSWIYNEYFGALSMSGGYMQFQAPQLSVLPMVEIIHATPNETRSRAIQDAQDHYKKGAFENILLATHRESSANRTDTIHDLLAYLAEQMIAMHKDKQALTADFWTDLEGAADPAAFHKLRDKGKQEAGLAKDPALAPHLNPDSKSTRTLDESLAWDEAAFKGFVRALAGPVDGLSRLVKVYNSHAPRYRDLVERIGRTDWLIDQIVYKLYGLTDDEIAIVEGRV